VYGGDFLAKAFIALPTAGFVSSSRRGQSTGDDVGNVSNN
jgi:hypothetical protein